MVVVRADVASERAVELSSPGILPLVVAWVGQEFGGAGPEHADVVLADHDVDTALDAVRSAPIAATSLVVLLRSSEQTTVEHGLAAESAVYSTLQSGPEFARWRASNSVRSSDHPANRSDHPATVLTCRTDDVLRVVLNRPERHNAISIQLRDELTEALALAHVDSTIERVELTGAGPSFCAGGDLDEFGSRANPSIAHITRLARSPALLCHQLGARLRATIHGHTLGGGIELAAFAGTVQALPNTVIGLPEVSLGLIPGAGGTVSIARRIGRQRTAALAITGLNIDTPTAHGWGLVDEIVAK